MLADWILDKALDDGLSFYDAHVNAGIVDDGNEILF